MKDRYSPQEVQKILLRVGQTYNIMYETEGNDDDFCLVGLSPKESRWRLEPFIPFFQECPTKSRIHVNDDGSWTLSRVEDSGPMRM